MKTERWKTGLGIFIITVFLLLITGGAPWLGQKHHFNEGEALGLAIVIMIISPFVLAGVFALMGGTDESPWC